MPRTLEYADYLHLPPAERLLLAKEIIDSVVAETQAVPLTDEQLAQINRRCADIDSGRTICIPFDDAMRQLRRR